MNPLDSLAGTAGIEPAANRLTADCSTSELCTQFIFCTNGGIRTPINGFGDRYATIAPRTYLRGLDWDQTSVSAFAELRLITRPQDHGGEGYLSIPNVNFTD